MKHSVDKILTTHAGSLPRPEDWLAMMMEREKGAKLDAQAYAQRNRQAVSDIVKQQLDLGIDIVDDGEQGKPSFLTYVNERLGGYEPAGPRGSPWAGSREVKSFPEYYEAMARGGGGPGASISMVCRGPITYKGEAALKNDLENFTAALKGRDPADAFIPAISPANIEEWQKNAYYKTEEEYLYAIADAMHVEYEAIVDAGFLLQIDDPRFATYYAMSEVTLDECRKWAEKRVEALNHALRGIPEDRIRYHTCYSINMGPRVHDIELKDIVDIMLKIKAGAYSFETANPRHEHEWRVWETAKLPDGKIIIPGVISHTTMLVEHPQLIADWIVRFAKIVGRENVIAGSDCGFATFASSKEIHPSIVWAKLGALADGARIATQELWGRA
ncbi:MAG TPA: cobalamin-independent methionine synthase II family protein [Stellaceae bacterium]|jgi:5-methyltetrahydropteroyltriglutamate--homocysteine methyltransferase|nr:cobalamin-independent methionine synthase II family protein [Stellaceae bacterium]